MDTRRNPLSSSWCFVVLGSTFELVRNVKLTFEVPLGRLLFVFGARKTIRGNIIVVPKSMDSVESPPFQRYFYGRQCRIRLNIQGREVMIVRIAPTLYMQLLHGMTNHGTCVLVSSMVYV